MRYDPVVISLALSHSFARQLIEETEKAALVQNVHTIIPPAVLQLATLVSAKVIDEGWLTPSSNDPLRFI